MRLLRLGNSYEFDPNISPEANKATLAEAIIEQAIGEPVESLNRVAWPDDIFFAKVDRWLENQKPDVVFLVISSYWFTYVSVPQSIERRLGRVGKRVNSVGKRLAGTRWLAHNRGFRAVRKATISAIGGSTFFTVEQVNERMEACIRQILAHEDVALAVRGPRLPFATEGSANAKKLAEERRRAVHTRMRDLCALLHVEYVGWDDASSPQDQAAGMQGDLVHATEATHREQAELEARAIIAAWSRARV